MESRSSHCDPKMEAFGPIDGRKVRARCLDEEGRLRGASTRWWGQPSETDLGPHYERAAAPVQVAGALFSVHGSNEGTPTDRAWMPVDVPEK